MIAFGVYLFIFLLQNQAAAFLLPSTCSVGRNQHLKTVNFIENEKHIFHQKCLTRRFGALDNDEDEDDDDDEYDDEDKGPLANGIDSVSWLPSVEGAKGDNMPIESTKEVRFVSSSVCK